MNKEEKVIMGFRDLLNKMVLLNKFKMEDSLKGYKPSEVHCIEYIGRNADCNVTKLEIYVSLGHAAPAFMGMILIAAAIPVLYKRTHVNI